MKAKWFGTLLIVALLTMTLVPVVGAQDGPISVDPLVPPPSNETGEMTHENTGLYFVQLQSAPLAEGGRANSLNADRRAFEQAARNANVAYTIRYDFRNLWNGYSVALTRGNASELSLLDGVKAVYPVATVSIPETTTISPDLSTALNMTGASDAQSELGYTGAGIRVAVMDTGVDYDHPDLGGCFGSGCRVATGWDFVGDNFDANPSNSTYNLTTSPDNDPDDCNGHGTHVAGIVGANGEAIGVAPGVTFGAYRVFGCNGSTTADIMIAAMERALADNMDILNMSIGSAFQWPQYPTSVAANNLVNRGVVVVASIGNSGADGLYSAGAPGLGDKVIGVASFDNSHINVLTFNVNPSGQQVGYLPLSTTPDPPTSGDTPEIVYLGRGCGIEGPPYNITTPDPYLADPAGKVALVTRGACSFNNKYSRAVEAGAVGVLIENNVTGIFAGGGVTSLDKWGVGISNTDGAHIRGLIDAGQHPTLTWTDVRINAANPTGGLLSSFSSYGPGPDLSFKPDIGAPGGLIRSTYPLEKGEYATISGTSMSSPHVAGAAALLLEARPDVSHQAVDEILQNSADPRPWSGNPGLGFADHAFRQGAGMLDIDDAILAITHIAPSEIALGEGQNTPKTFTLTLSNNGASDVSYNLSHVEGIAVGGTIAPAGFSIGGTIVTFSAPSVTVPAGGSATVDATITSTYANRLYGGWLVFTPQGSGQVYRVPYAGFSGDYQSLPGLTPTAAGFPLIGAPTECIRVVGNECVGGTFDLAAPGLASYSLADVYNMPHVLAHFEHQIEKFDIQVFDSTGRSWHFASRYSYLPRNTTSTGFFSFVWDGTTRGGNTVYEVPDGTYYLVVTALKAGGDSSNPDHVQTWTSPNITIDRP